MTLTIESIRTLYEMMRGGTVPALEGDRLLQDLVRNNDVTGRWAAELLTRQGYVPPISQASLWLLQDGCGLHHKEVVETQPDTLEEWDDQYINRNFARLLVLWGRRKLETVLRRLVDTGIASPQLVDVALLPERETEQWVDELAKLSNSELRKVVKVAGQDAIRQVGVGVGFNLNDRRVINYLDDASRIIGRRETDRFRDKIRKELIDSFEAGENLAATSARIETIGERFVPWRSKMIARTETNFAGTSAKELGWQQTSVVTHKSFALAPGGCPWCESASEMLGGLDENNVTKKQVKLGEPFFTKGTVITATFKDAEGQDRQGQLTLDYSPTGGHPTIPPVHPNCRCDLVPITYDEVITE